MLFDTRTNVCFTKCKRRRHMRLKYFIASLLLTTQQFVGFAEPVKPPTPTPVVQHTQTPRPPKPQKPREIAQRVSRDAGFDLTQWRCLDMLWTKESHFNPKARNKRSGAYGIAQFMPQTWHNYKVKKTSDPRLQIKYGLRYITRRYGSPCAAWKHSRRHGWY